MPHRFLPLLLALALAGPRPATAGEQDTAALVARVTAALGGAEALAAVEGYTLQSDVEGMGLTGTSRSHVRFPDAQRNELALGPLALITVLSGDEGWYRDHNGSVERLNPTQLADAVTSRYIE